MLLQLNVYPGLKGLKEMLGTVPAWIHYEERERVEVRCHIVWQVACQWRRIVDGSGQRSRERMAHCGDC